MGEGQAVTNTTMEIWPSDNISIVSASVEYYYPDDDATIHLSVKDDWGWPYISMKIDWEISFDYMDELMEILNDFSTRFPLPIPPPSNDTE